MTTLLYGAAVSDMRMAQIFAYHTTQTVKLAAVGWNLSRLLMSNMAHYPNNNPGAARFIGGMLFILLLAACVVLTVTANWNDAALTIVNVP